MAQIHAVIYCRCSTDEESQADALKNQVLESIDCVEEQGWFLSDQYVESKSGTTTKGRQEYNRLFEDLLSNRFDIIVIKSQDRLMRNVKDWYLFLDRMLSHGKRLFIYLEQKFYSSDDALITGIKAILAEEYSRELSKKINNAHRNRQKNGGKAMLTSRVFGYLKQADGTVSIDESEAAIIRKIYEYSAAGYGCRTVSDLLLKQGLKKRTGMPVRSGFIGRMIRNPIYKGMFVMNRLHYDFETKQTLKIPESEWICDKNTVPAIVSEELWERANTAMTERGTHVSKNGSCIKGRRIGKYDLSGKIVCGMCESPYYRTWRRSFANVEEVVTEWKCCNYLENGRRRQNRMDRMNELPPKLKEGCNNIHVDEQILSALLEQVSVQYFDFKNQDKESIINHTVKILQNTFSEKTTDSEWNKQKELEDKIVCQKELLLTKLLEGIISDSDYQKRNRSLEDQLAELERQKEESKQRELEVKSLEQRIEIIKSRLKAGGVEKATVNQMLTDVRKIVIFDWHIEIVFDSAEADKTFTISAAYPFPPTTERGRYLDKVKIVNILMKSPEVTAKKIASMMERPVTLIQNRMKELRDEGYICYQGKGGHGRWEVLNALIVPEKYMSSNSPMRDDTQSYHNVPSSKHLAAINNQVSKTCIRCQKFPDDNAHQT